MKWPWVPEPENWAMRKRVIFALVPRPCVDGYVRWLEHLEVTERYEQYSIDGERPHWEEVSARSLAASTGESTDG